MTDKKIRLFVSDIDGCLSEPFVPFDLVGLGRLRERADIARKRGGPLLSICTGRGFGYAEAMVQALGIDLPILFEAGAGLYDPASYAIRWSPSSTKAERRQIQSILSSWEELYGNDPDISIDIFKQTQASIVVRNSAKMESMLASIKTVEGLDGSLIVADTHVSIDVFPPHLSKANGILWLSDELGIAPDEMAFIGDSTGDVGAIEVVGIGVAPANAWKHVKESADLVCTASHIEGVIEAFDYCVRHNETNGIGS